MHLLIPFAAALSDAATQAIPGLRLPALTRLLARLAPAVRDSGDEYSLSPPHERALAACWGWTTQGAGAAGHDGLLPFAARQAAADGIAVGERPWALLTPVHWQVGREQVTLAPPAALRLDDAESRAFLDAIRPLFESEGWTLARGAPERWYASHDSLAALPAASLDRVIGRNVDLWLGKHARTRLLRRLQNEVQMLLYQHPLNDAREARGELPLNSFWASGCGRWQPADEAAVTVDWRLREPLLADDIDGWRAAWQALDASAVAALAQRAERGEPVSLTLCGERSAQRFDRAPRSAWQRLAGAFGRGGVDVATLLVGL